jgi:FkbM family methyltransferase
MQAVKSLFRSVLTTRPLAPLRRFIRRRRASILSRDDDARIALYRQFLRAGDLCFDVGANIGNRLRVFRRLGARVIAFEPQSSCFSYLKDVYERDQGVVLVKKALGCSVGTAEMAVSTYDVFSSLSTDFVSRVIKTGRFDTKWDKNEVVQVTTLDSAISQYGRPRFIKIDVEGFELEVLRGLATPVPALSFEWTPEMTPEILACLDHIGSLGPAEFNISYGESMRLSHLVWFGLQQMKDIVNVLKDDTWLFGDIYIRSQLDHERHRISPVGSHC